MEQQIIAPAFSHIFEVNETKKATIKKEVSSVEKNMRFAFWLNFVFACIEFAGGILTNSVTVLSDAIHDLGDSIAIGLSLALEKKSRKGRTAAYTYGQRRFSILAAFITSFVLIIGSVFIVKEALYRFWHLEEVNASGVFWLAVLGIIFNGFAVLKLKKGSNESLNQRGIMLHLLEDALGWMAVLIGSVIMYYTSWYWIDPLLSLGIAGLILWNAIKNLWASFRIFLQAAPKNFDENKLIESLKNIPGITQVTQLNCWTMDDEFNILTVHLFVSNVASLTELKQIKQHALNEIRSFHIHQATVEIEVAE